MEKLDAQWRDLKPLNSYHFTCGYCGLRVASKDGWDATVPSGHSSTPVAHLRICPQCNAPTYLGEHGQVPSPPVGAEVDSLPDDVYGIHREARLAISAGAHTAGVLALRKLLMNIAVEQGVAKPGKGFTSYIEQLAVAGYIPPNGRGWVDHIRQKGNDATHEIALMDQQDAEELLAFTEMLLTFIYEFPGRIPAVESEEGD